MRLNVFLLILLVGAVTLNYGIRRDMSKPNDEWLPEASFVQMLSIVMFVPLGQVKEDESSVFEEPPGIGTR